MVVEPRGAWEHSAYQSDNQFVLEVRAAEGRPEQADAGPRLCRARSCRSNFQNIEVRALLQVIADFTNFNVVTSDTVTGNVTLAPEGRAVGPGARHHPAGQEPGPAQVGQRDPDRAQGRAQRQGEDRARVASSRSLSLSRCARRRSSSTTPRPRKSRKGLTGTDGGRHAARRRQQRASCRQRGSVIFETRTNQLFVSDIPSKLEEVQALIARIDIPVRQVLIEARIVDRRRHASAARWASSCGYVDLARRRGGNCRATSIGGDNRVAVGGNYNAVGATTGADHRQRRQFNDTHVRQPAGHRHERLQPPRRSALSLFSAAANRFLNLELSALEADGKGKVVSSPRVITADQAEGVDRAGRGAAVPESPTSSGATAIAVPQGQPQARGHAADHAGRQRDPRRGRHQGQRRPLDRSRASRSTPSTSRRRCWSRTAARS